MMKGWGNQKGFTLLEVLISLSVFLIVLSAVYLTFQTSHATSIRGENKVEVQQTARVAIGLLAREVRAAGYDPSNPPVIPGLASPTAVQVANANTITFIADVDGDNVTDQVTYRLQGTQVFRDLSSWDGLAFPAPVPEELADGVTTFTFTYFDGSDNPPATLADIRRITVRLTIEEGTGAMQQTFPLTMDLRLRNLQ